MIEESLVPEHIREKVLEAESYSDAEWRRIVSWWSPFYKQLAIKMRKTGEKGREDLLRSGISKNFEQLFDFEEDVDLIFSIICLSDEALDKAIRIFRPQ